MSKPGKVKTGFSLPYVALLDESGSTPAYTSGQRLARGVEVDIDVNTSDDNPFYADNMEEENEPGKFTDGTLNLTVDGLLIAAERLIMGLPSAGTDGWTAYDDNQSIPYVAVGFIVRFRSDGEDIYTPFVLPKVAFDQIKVSAATQEENIDWQTSELTGKIKKIRLGDHPWKYVGADFESEALAEAALKTKLGISTGTTTT